MHYRLFISLIIWGKVGWAFAQPTYFFETGRAQATVHSNGELTEILIPADSNKKAFDKVLLWIGGRAMGNTYVAANHSEIAGSDFYPGALKVADASADDTSKWNKVFTVTRQEIDFHLANYNKPGYVMPQSISDWPGSGALGFADVIAPYIDFDQNGKYEPELGDVPYIDANNAKGKKAACVVFNDKYSNHAVSGGAAMGVEVLLLITEFENQPENTLFLTYYIHNRSSQVYDSTYIGLWADFAVGKKGNEFVSTDSLRNLFFAYNDTNSYDSLPEGFGINPPASGVLFLNHPLQYSITTDRTNIDNAVAGIPDQTFHFYNFLKRYWKDNTQLNLGVNGWSTGIKANYIYSGDVCSRSGWTEEGALLFSGEKKMIGSYGPVSFKKNEAQVLKAALVWARGNGATHSTCILKMKADEVEEFYREKVSGIAKRPFLEVAIYPNPARDRLYLEYPGMDEAQVFLYDLSGKCVLSGQGHEIAVGALSEGLYYLHIVTAQGEARTKFIKSR